METIICDISALDYWRTPPLVQLLLAGNEDVPELRGAVNAADVLALRAAIAEEPLCQAMLRPGPSTRNAGAKAKRLRPVIPLLATNQTAPVDILAREHRACHASDIVTPRLWSHDLPLGSCVDISDEVRVATPAFALLQLAGRLDLATLLLIASELCGSFAIFEPCRPIADALQKMARAGKIPAIGGWEPFVDGSGAVSTLCGRDRRLRRRAICMTWPSAPIPNAVESGLCRLRNTFSLMPPPLLRRERLCCSGCLGVWAAKA